MKNLPNLDFSKQDIQILRNRAFDYGGESVIVRSTTGSSVYKIFDDDFLKDPKDLKEIEKARDNKLQKVRLLYSLDNFNNDVKVLSTISVDGNFIGYEMTYNLDDISLLMAPLTTKEKIRYLKLVKDKLLYFENYGIVYSDIKSDNILVNDKKKTISFCDLDNIQIGNYPIDIKDEIVDNFILNYGKLDEKIHSYMHNLLTLKELFNIDGNYYEVLNYLENGNVSNFLNEDGNRITKELVKVDNRYSGKYVIDYL